MANLTVLCFVFVSFASAATHSIDTVKANPASIMPGSSATVLVTAKITDPVVISAGVNLLSASADGTVTGILGAMHDDGLNGDAVAGDHVYSSQLTIHQSSPGTLYYRVSAPFKGSLTRVLSDLIVVGVWNPITLDTVPVTVSTPPQWSVQQDEVTSPSLFRRTVSNVANFSPTYTTSSLQNESEFDITVRRNVNPSNLPIDSWFNTVKSSIGVPILSTSSTTVSGRPALLVQLDEIQYSAHYFVSGTGGDVYEIVYSLEQPKFLAQYQAMLQSLQLP